MGKRPDAYTDGPERCDQWERRTGNNCYCKLCRAWCNCGSMGCATRADGGVARLNAAAEVPEKGEQG